MATLVQFLAAGVNGAANGSATFLLRGTASSAQSVMYNEFEGLTQPATNVVTLDANGAAEVYVDAYVDVELKNSAGTTLRTVTVGNSAPLVEVQSTSFTGTDYDGNPANTVGEPITLKALLDKWILSAGSPDWQVLIGGVATDMDSAFAGISGLIFNVKDPAYGALGDGVTDDTTAIIAANAAAAGRPVYFPPGTYKVSTITLTDANLNWFGAGVGASIISGNTNTNLLNFTDATNTARKNLSGLSFTSSGAYTRLINLSDGQIVNINQCSFDGTNCTESCIRNDGDAPFSSYRISNCDFIGGSSSSFVIRNGASGGNRQYFIDSCTFTVPAGFTGDILAGADMTVTGCIFDASLVVAGVYYHVDAEGSAGEYIGNFVGNTFYDGGSDGFAFKLTGLGTICNFSEDGNTFSGFVAPAASAEKGHTYDITDAESGAPGVVRLGSRKGRTIHITNPDAAFTCGACLEAEHLVITSTQIAGPIIFTVPALIPGLSGWVVVEPNTGGGAINYAFRGSDSEGPLINVDNEGDKAFTLTAGDTDFCVAQYHTTVLGDGTFRSFVNTEIKYDA